MRYGVYIYVVRRQRVNIMTQLASGKQNKTVHVPFGHIRSLKTTLNDRIQLLYKTDRLLLEYRQSAVSGRVVEFLCAL